jgi:hypothetical protein
VRGSGLEAGPGGARGIECLRGKGLEVCDFGFGFRRGYAELAAKRGESNLKLRYRSALHGIESVLLREWEGKGE